LKLLKIPKVQGVQRVAENRSVVFEQLGTIFVKEIQKNGAALYSSYI